MDGQADTFAGALERAMAHRSLSLEALRDLLADTGHPVSLATLSYWRSGRREPRRRTSLELIPHLERVLGLDPDALLDRLAPRDRTHAPQPFDELADVSAATPIVGESDVNRVLFHLVVDVGADRRISRARITQVFVATRDGVDGVTIFVGPDDVGGNQTVLRPVSGCRFTDVRDLGDGVRASHLWFDRPLARDESVVVEYEAVELDNVETEYGLVAEQQLEEAMVWVRFDPSALPSRAWVWFEEGGLRHDWDVDLHGSSGLHYRQLAFGPGALAARWEW